MSTRQLIGVTEITEYSLKTASSEAAFFQYKAVQYLDTVRGEPVGKNIFPHVGAERHCGD